MFLLVSLALLASANALEISMVDGRIHLSAENCQIAESGAAELQAWQRARGETECSFELQRGSSCRIDVHDCLPERLTSLHRKTSIHPGPNCWNFVLVEAGILPALRQSLPEEISFYTESELCKEVQGPPKPGDMGLLRSSKGEEVHGFLHIGENLIYAKHADSTAYPYGLMTRAAMMKSYGKDRNCKISRSSHPDCYHRLTYWRCSPKENPSPAWAWFNEWEKNWEELNFKPEFRLGLKDKNENAPAFARVQKHLDQLIHDWKTCGGAKAAEIAAAPPLEQQALKLRLASLRHQAFRHEQSVQNNRNWKEIKGRFNELKRMMGQIPAPAEQDGNPCRNLSPSALSQ